MLMPAWLFAYCLLGSGIYWGLQTFMPNPAAGWTAAGVTVVVWYFVRRVRRQAAREALIRRAAEEEWLASELEELEERRRADAST